MQSSNITYFPTHPTRLIERATDGKTDHVQLWTEACRLVDQGSIKLETVMELRKATQL
jgi:hypothetical protein